MGAYLRKYATLTATGTNIGLPMPKAGSADFATGSDWTPSVGDVKLSIDGGTQANIGTLPTYLNGQWIFVLTALELTGKSIRVAIVDSATKAVDDQFFAVETFGNASAMYTFDFSATGGKVPATIASGDIATDAISAAAIAAAAVTKVQAGLSTQASVDTIDDFLDTEVAAIKAKTDGLPADPADASDIAALFATVNSTLATIAAYIDTEVAAIKAKTDNLPTDPADASDVAGAFTSVNGTLATIAGYIDTEVAAIYTRLGAPAGASIAADIAGVSGGGGGGLDAAATRAALGLASANLDTQLALRTGFKLASDGLDAITVETGVNLRQAASVILASTAGVLSGAATSTVTIKGGNVSTTRITAQCDTDGNRTSVTLAIPT